MISRPDDKTIEFDLDLACVEHETEYCWAIRLPKVVPAGGTVDNPKSTCLLTLLEDGKPLGPANATHSRIRSYGSGLYSHWENTLYFSTSDNSSPLSNSRAYHVVVELDAVPNAPKPQAMPEGAELDLSLLFPRISYVKDALAKTACSHDPFYEPEREDELKKKLRILEAKVEYLLDELYTAKSQLRHLTPKSETMLDLAKFQLTTFDYQWGNLPYHDEFLTNPDWQHQAIDDIVQRSGKPADWFKGKRVLDCGCGPGRHTWTFAKLGAQVTSFDMSDNGLAAARASCKDFPNVTIEKRNILDALPYDCDYDLVWCFGVVHCTGDTLRALRNISRHVKVGGMIYFMVYAEPSRNSLEDYVYYHEVYAMRQAIRHLNLEQRAALIKGVQGERHALGWFDAVSSEINDLYTMEELVRLLSYIGFENIQRTMPNDNSHNVIATKKA